MSVDPESSTHAPGEPGIDTFRYRRSYTCCADPSTVLWFHRNCTADVEALALYDSGARGVGGFGAAGSVATADPTDVALCDGLDTRVTMRN